MQLHQITFTRFVAAMTVVFFHYGMDVFPANVPYLSEVVSAGPIAVNYFYILSGFIMAFAYYRPAQGTINKKKYWMARLARIYPLYIAGVILMVAADYKTLPSMRLATLPLQVSMLQSWIPGFPLTLNAPGWSLSVEVVFYICFPYILLHTYKHGLRRIVAGTLLLWVATQAVILVMSNSSGYVAGGGLHDFLFYNPILHLNSFLIGFISGVYFRRDFSARDSKHNTRWLVLSVVIIGCLMMGRPLLEEATGLNIAFTNGLIAPAFIAFVLLLARQKGVVTKALGNKAFILLGEASFSLYILQEPMHLIYSKIVSSLDLSPTLHFYLYVLFLIVVSIGSYRLFESPMRRIINRRFRRTDTAS